MVEAGLAGEVSVRPAVNHGALGSAPITAVSVADMLSPSADRLRWADSVVAYLPLSP
jgi:hypothetical protein